LRHNGKIAKKVRGEEKDLVEMLVLLRLRHLAV